MLRGKWKSILLLTCMLCGLANMSHGQDYMVGDRWESLQALAADAHLVMDEMLREFTDPPCNMWTEPCGSTTPMWTTIVGQDGPGWIPADVYDAAHGATSTPGWGAAPTIRNDHWLAFLDAVLGPGFCYDNVTPADVAAMRNTFEANKAKILATELTIPEVWLRATVIIITLNEYIPLTTGATTCIDLPLGLGTECIDVPSLFGHYPKLDSTPLLNEAHPNLGEMIANLTAAYMTIGDERAVEYWSLFMGRLALTFVQELLPVIVSDLGKSIDDKVLDYMQKHGIEIPEGGLNLIDVEKEEKYPPATYSCPPYGDVSGVDISIPLDIGGSSTTMRIRVRSEHTCDTINMFKTKFNCTDFDCLPEFFALLPDQGDFNMDGVYNIDSFIAAGEDLTDWMVNEGIVAPWVFFTQDLALPAEPVDEYGAPYTLSVGVDSTLPDPFTIQWYSGLSPDALSPIDGETGTTLSENLDVYSWGGINMSRYYQVSATSGTCESRSSILELAGPEPPVIAILTQPAGGDFVPGQSTTLSVQVEVAYGTPNFQWQILLDDDWTNMPGQTGSTLSFPNLTETDTGEYRVQVLNQLGPNPLYWIFSESAQISVYPRSYISVDVQPVGGALDIGEDHIMTVLSIMPSGTLAYRWQVNTGAGFVNLTDWSPDNTTQAISGAAIADAGVYRAQIQLTYSPEEVYQTNSAVAVITVNHNAIFRVDPTAPGPEQDGATWATAFHTLQPAINAAYTVGGGQVWVAGGPAGSPVVYNEPRTENWGGTTGSLVMKSQVSVYGGFSGWRNGTGLQETGRTQRARWQNVTVIDGSMSRTGGRPAYNVVIFGEEAGSTVNSSLDGFWVRGGYAVGVPGRRHTFRGGGIYIYQSSPAIMNCWVSDNRAAVSGGGINAQSGVVDGAYPMIMSTVINGNRADRVNDDENTAPRGGGGLSATGNNIFSSDVTVNYVTITNNIIGALGYTAYGANSGGVYAWNSSPVVMNSIVWGNDAGGLKLDESEGAGNGLRISYSTLQERHPGAGNIGVSPLLNENLMPQEGSPAIDAGDPAAGEGDDLRGVYRPLDGGSGAARVDMGAFEYSANGPVAACVTDPLDLNIVLTTSIADPYDALDAASLFMESPIWKIELTDNAFNCSHVGVPGTQVTLIVTDMLGRSSSCAAPVNVFETEAPVMNLPAQPWVAQCDRSTALLPVVTAVDNCDGSIGTTIVDYDGFDTGNPAAGTYNVVYRAEDSSGNWTENALAVIIEDDQPPVISLNGPAAIIVNAGEPYVDAVTAFDACDGAIAVNINYGGLNAANPVVGVYTLDYTASDSMGNNAAPASRTVTIVSEANPYVVSVAVINTWNVAVTFNKEMGPSALVPANYTVSGSGLGSLTANPDSISTQDDITFTLTWDCPNKIMYNGGDILVEVAAMVADSGSNQMIMPRSATHLGGAVAAAPIITRNGPAAVQVECGGVYLDAGASATDACGSVLTASVSGDNVNPSEKGTYVIRYDVTDSGGNAATQVTRTVNVVDTTPPILTLLGAPVMNLSCGSSFSDPGAMATDDCDGNLTGAIVVGGQVVNSDMPGTYVITYNVSDSSNNAAAQATRTVNVSAPAIPVITLLGASPVTMVCGTLYSDAGATAVDGCGNILTGSIVITGSVNINAPGAYILAYNVTDGAGNAALEVTRTVNVVASGPPVITLIGSNTVTVECSGSYVDAGAMAQDACGNTLTSSIVVGGLAAIDTSVLGASYEVTYDVQDVEGTPAATITRTVTVIDTTPPVLGLVGPDAITATLNQPYVDPGATATDVCDDDATLTAAIVVDASAVDTSVLGGVYTVYYDVMDSSGNPAQTIARTVHIADGNGPIVTDVTVESPLTVLVTFCCSDMGGNDNPTVTNPAYYLVSGSGVGSLAPSPNSVVHVAGNTYRLSWTCPAIMLNGGDIAITVNDAVENDAGVPVSEPKGGVHAGGAIASAPSVRAPIVDAPDCQDRLIPTSVTHQNMGNVAVSRVQDNPLTPDGLAITGTNNATTWAQFGFEDPNPGCPLTGIQTFRLYVIRRGTHATNPQFNVVLYEDGVLVQQLTSNISLGASGFYSFAWDSSLVNDPDNVEVRFNTLRGGSTLSRTYADLDAVDWLPTFAPELVPLESLIVECAEEISDLPDDTPATDACGNPLTGIITSYGDLDMTNPTVGVYTVTYTATDSAGNIGTSTQEVDVKDTIAPVVTIDGPNPLVTQCGVVGFSLPEAFAEDNCDSEVEVSITSYGGLNPEALVAGTYSLRYVATDNSGNTGSRILTVIVEQTAPPVVVIDGAGAVTLECGIAASLPNATAIDSCGTALSVVITDYDGLVPENPAVGLYTVVYSATDNENQTGTDTLTVMVEDTLAPLITLDGQAEIWMFQDDLYVEPGYSAMDLCEGDMTLDVVVGGDLDTNQVGTYTVTYDGTDALNNAADQRTRIVHVIDTAETYVVDVSVIDALNVAVTFNKPMGEGVLDPVNYTVSGSGAGTLTPNPAAVAAFTGNSFILTWECPDMMLNGGDITIVVAGVVEDAMGNPMTAPTSDTHVGGAIAAAPSIELPDHPGDLACGVVIIVVPEEVPATDACDAELVAVLSDDDGLNFESPTVGEYTLVYHVEDAAGNAGTALLILNVEDTAPVVTIDGPDPLIISCDLPLELPDAIAWDDCDAQEMAVEVTDLGGLDLENPALGEYVVTYTTIEPDSDGQYGTASLTVQTAAPQLHIDGPLEVIAECSALLELPLVFAVDDCGNDLTDDILTNMNGLDLADPAVGVYTIVYSVSDAGAIMTTIELVVIVEDSDSPVVSLIGDEEVYLAANEDYEEEGVTAWDLCDGLVLGLQQDRFIPAAIVAQSGMTGGLDRIQDDPMDPDDLWITNTSNSSAWLRTSFDRIPAWRPLTGIQTLRLRVRRSGTAATPYFNVRLLEDGVELADFGNHDVTATGVGTVFSFPWDMGLVSDPSKVEVRIETYRRGDGASNESFSYVHIGAVDWVPNYALTPIPELIIGGYVSEATEEHTLWMVTYDGIFDAAGNVGDQIARSVYLDPTVPYVESVEVVDAWDVVVTFSRPMGAGVFSPTNYTVSGTGVGTMAQHPDHVSFIDDRTYRLTWSCPSMMSADEDITILVALGVESAEEVLIGVGRAGTHSGGALAISPTIDLIGDSVVTIGLNEPYIEDGATAADVCGSDLSGHIVIGGDIVNSGIFGTYFVTYDVIDGAGNAAETATRTVHVSPDVPLTVVKDLTDLTLAAGANYIWTIDVIGGAGPVSFQWFHNVDDENAFLPITDGSFGAGAFNGTATNALNIHNMIEEMEGLYRVEVSDDLTTILVGPAMLYYITGVPSAGVLGLAALALAVALGGVKALRRRRQGT